MFSNRGFRSVTGIFQQSQFRDGKENLKRETYYHKSVVEFQTVIEIQIAAGRMKSSQFLPNCLVSG